MEKIIKKISKYSDDELSKYFIKTDIKVLHEMKIFLDDIYYNSGLSTGLTDFQYDLLKETLQQREPDYIPPIGAKIRSGENEIKLQYYLGSMNKFKPENISELERWIEKNQAKECIIQDKLDGISCLLIIKDEKIGLYTRGDGEVGSDISYFAPYFKNIPKKRDINIAVRGELIMKKKTFEEKYSSEFANPRNFVSGRVGSKTVRKGLEDIDFVAYEIVSTGILMKPEDQLKILKEYGFSIVNNSILKDINVDELVSCFINAKENSEYEIDGIIVQNNVPYKRNTTGNPSYAFAFKVRLDTNLAEVEVEEVEWNVSKWGAIKPRIRIIPVNLNGVTITYTTGFNAKYIMDNQIGPGTILKITRSGDVIPFVVEVLKSTFAQMPDIDYKWSETKVDIYTQENEDTMCIKLVTSFFTTLKIKHVSEATVRKMYEHGLNNVLKIIEAQKEDFEKIEGFGKRLAERTYDNIHQGLKNISVATLLGASGVFGMGLGTKKLETLLNSIPNLLDLYDVLSEHEIYIMINNVEGFSDKTTIKIVENLKWAKKFLKNMSPYITLKEETIINTENDFEGIKVVFTGFRDIILEQKIKERGGKVLTSVSKNTSILVVDDIHTGSSKAQKAKELDIPIYEKEEFLIKFNL